jgi:hypothetical protein
VKKAMNISQLNRTQKRAEHPLLRLALQDTYLNLIKVQTEVTNNENLNKAVAQLAAVLKI